MYKLFKRDHTVVCFFVTIAEIRIQVECVNMCVSFHFFPTRSLSLRVKLKFVCPSVPTDLQTVSPHHELRIVRPYRVSGICLHPSIDKWCSNHRCTVYSVCTFVFLLSKDYGRPRYDGQSWTS